MAFLFAWTEFWIVRPGNVAGLALVFAEYAAKLGGWNANSFAVLPLAFAPVAVATLGNLLGIQTGKWAQNTLTTSKVIGLLVIAASIWKSPVEDVGSAMASRLVESAGHPTLTSFATAMVLIMFSYGGWNDACYLAGRVIEPQKNLTRGLVGGVLAVIAIYLGANAAFVIGLGWDGFASSAAPAADLVNARWGAQASGFLSLLVCVSCLSSIHGTIFTGAWLWQAVGEEFAQLRWLASTSESRAPRASVVAQSFVAACLLTVVGSRPGSLDRYLTFGAPWFWTFLLLSIFAYFRFRHSETSERVFLAPGYPWLAILFLAGTLFVSAASYVAAFASPHAEGWAALATMALGALVSLALRRRD